MPRLLIFGAFRQNLSVSSAIGSSETTWSVRMGQHGAFPVTEPLHWPEVAVWPAAALCDASCPAGRWVTTGPVGRGSSPGTTSEHRLRGRPMAPTSATAVTWKDDLMGPDVPLPVSSALETYALLGFTCHLSYASCIFWCLEASGNCTELFRLKYGIRLQSASRGNRISLQVKGR